MWLSDTCTWATQVTGERGRADIEYGFIFLIYDMHTKSEFRDKYISLHCTDITP